MTEFEHIRRWEEGDFTLDLYDTYGWTGGGKSRLAYELRHQGEIVFEGNDFGCSPLHAVDSDATVAALLTFLSLRPGDTDADYFDSYTAKQLDWACRHGEELSLYAYELEEATRE